jgi:cytohesin
MRRVLRIIAILAVVLACALLCTAGWAMWRINAQRDLIGAILDHNTARARRLLRFGADPNARNDFTREHVSLVEGIQLEALRFALTPGSMPHGKSALALAIQTGNDVLYRALFAAGVRVDERDYWGRTAMREAVIKGRVDVIHDLIARGADPCSRDLEGITPLRMAIRLGQREAARVLRAAGATERTIPDGALQNDLALIRARIGHEAVDTPLQDGRTPLAVCASFGNAEAVRLLLAAGAGTRSRAQMTFPGRDPRDYRHGGVTELTPLMWAAGSGSLETVRLLLDAGADPMARDDQGRTALHWVANSSGPDRISVYRALLGRGVPVDCQDDMGVTPLMAEAGRSLAASRFLIAQGASVTLRNRAGKSARDIAKELGPGLLP